METSKEKILNALNKPQQEAVLHVHGPLLVLAGAGTGKTRVITYRVAYLLSLGIRPENILAITFTNKAAEEMKRRISVLAPGQGAYVWVSTFHSFAARLLRMEAQNIGISKNFVIYDEIDQKNVIKECLRELNIDEKKYKIGIVQDIINRAKDDLIDAGSYAIYASAENDALKHTIANVYTSYQKKLQQNSAVDFGDLLLKANDALHTSAGLQKKYQERFMYILVDEFQDTNRAQYVLIKHLTSENKNLCVVGDDDQSIYSWRGANIRNILGFENDFSGCRVVKLEQNYRSAKNILECAWMVIKNNRYRMDKKLWTLKQAGETIRLQMRPDEISEAGYVTQVIRGLVASGDAGYRDFAVFYRTNAQSRVIESALQKAKIPYVLVGTVRFYERKEIKDIVSYLRVIINPDDNVSLKRIINRPHRGIGDGSIKPFMEYAKRKDVSLWRALNHYDGVPVAARTAGNIKAFVDMITRFRGKRDGMAAVDLTRMVMEETGYVAELERENSYESKERLSNIRELLSAVAEHSELNPGVDIESFLSDVSLATDIDSWDIDRKGVDAVTLMTLHLAKGLEFETVFMTGMEEGLFPIGSAVIEENPSELEEERRLCYVGITRAKSRLFMSYTEVRRLYGQLRFNAPSRFIQEAGVSDYMENTTHPLDGCPGDAGEPDVVCHPDTVCRSDAAETHSDGTVDLNKLRTGRVIEHPDFGKGRIIKITGRGDEMKLTVNFECGGQKKILAKYADLKMTGSGMGSGLDI